MIALLARSMSPQAFRSHWPNAAGKVAVVAVLGVVLNVGFLRLPLASRLADPSVPHAVLLAWLCAVVVRLVWRGDDVRPSLRRHAWFIPATTRSPPSRSWSR